MENATIGLKTAAHTSQDSSAEASNRETERETEAVEQGRSELRHGWEDTEVFLSLRVLDSGRPLALDAASTCSSWPMTWAS